MTRLEKMEKDGIAEWEDERWVLAMLREADDIMVCEGSDSWPCTPEHRCDSCLWKAKLREKGDR
jgi:hypothetical protein